MSDIYELLADRLTTELGVNRERIRPEATFDDLELDSLAVVELGLIVQEEYGIDIDKELSVHSTMAEAVAYLEQATASLT